MDGQLAERLAELAADGLAEDTIVFHYSDNGGVLPRSKRYCYEGGHRGEMVVYVPSKWRHLMRHSPGTKVTSPVSFIDLAPTVLSLAGVAQPAQMRGTPFLGMRMGKPQRLAFGMDEQIDFIRTVTDGRWRYIRNYMPHLPWGQHQAFERLAKGYQNWEAAHRAGRLNAVQDRFFGRKPFEEFYDPSANPHEIRNLADAPAARDALAAMRRALGAHMVSINDNGFLPGGMPSEGYVESRIRAVYPFDRVWALGATAALADPLPVLRYWAATGLLIFGRAAAPAAAALAKAMRDDPSPQVRVVAADAVGNLDDPTEEVSLLARLVDQPPSWQVQLQALNALIFLGAASQPALPTIRCAAENEQEYVRNAGRYLTAVLTGTYTPASKIFDLERM